MNIRKITYFTLMLVIFSACSNKFLDLKPKGVLLPEQLNNLNGVNALLVAAYSLMDGVGAGNTTYHSSADNWVYGSVTADDAYKGSTSGDQPDITLIETYKILSDNNYFRGKWRAVYDGVARCNDVLQTLAKAEDVGENDRKLITAEARFLRAHYHFEAKKMFNHVPYIDETIYNPEDPEGTKVPNTEDIWPKIEADLKFAFETLPPRQSQPGRATKWAAAAMLAKANLFQKRFAEAKTLLDQIVTQGGYRLVDKYVDNFRAATNNNAESVLEVEHSVNDGAPGGQNGNEGVTLNYPYGGPTTCCGFFQPSQNLVNAFKTDASGLPLLDDFNNEDVTNDQGIESKDPFTPYAGALDPRLDHTVGRRGIPYLDHGPHPGKAWIRDQSYAGPYSPKKHMFSKADIGSATFKNNPRQNANNYRIIRYSHVLLWLAECEIEIGSMERARELVNMIRQRAMNPEGFVKINDSTNAANYKIDLYKTPWADKELARKAVRFEERLEFGMEGHRFFDLVRWGIAEQVLNKYVDKEKLSRTYKNGAVFQPKNIYFPIPLQEIVNSSKNGQPTLTQNEGY